MENNNTEIINDEIKKKSSKALKESQKRYYNKMKSDPEFQEKRRAYSKKHYDNNKEKVISRVKNYQKQVLELEQIERLYELQQEGLINIHTGDMTEEEYEKYNKRLLNKLSVLHLTS